MVISEQDDISWFVPLDAEWNGEGWNQINIEKRGRSHENTINVNYGPSYCPYLFPLEFS